MTLNRTISSSLLCLVMGGVQAQQTTGIGPSLENNAALTMAQRVIQYETILGVDIEPRLAACMDDRFQAAWLLPARADAEISAQTRERVRRALEVCRIQTSADPDEYRLAAQIRQGMEAQLRLAQEMAVAKGSAQACIDKSQDRDGFKACLSAAIPAGVDASHWAKWMALFDRRAPRVADGAVKATVR